MTGLLMQSREELRKESGMEIKSKVVSLCGIRNFNAEVVNDLGKYNEVSRIMEGYITGFCIKGDNYNCLAIDYAIVDFGMPTVIEVMIKGVSGIWVTCVIDNQNPFIKYRLGITVKGLLLLEVPDEKIEDGLIKEIALRMSGLREARKALEIFRESRKERG